MEIIIPENEDKIYETLESLKSYYGRKISIYNSSNAELIKDGILMNACADTMVLEVKMDKGACHTKIEADCKLIIEDAGNLETKVKE